MDAEQVENLITAIEKRPCLFDKTCPEYGNRNYLNAEWSTIALEVGCTENVVRRRWKKLRDYFLKNHREISSCHSGPAGVKKKKWYLYDRMHFILPFINEKNSSACAMPISSDEEDAGNDDVISRASDSSFTSFTPLDTHISRSTSLDNNSGNQQQDQDAAAVRPATTTTSDSHDPRRSRTNVFAQRRAKQPELDVELLQLQVAQRLADDKKLGELELDEDEHFFKSLLPKMRLMGTIDKMECQAEIHSVVLKYVKKTFFASAAEQLSVCKVERVQQHSPPPAPANYAQTRSPP